MNRYVVATAAVTVLIIGAAVALALHDGENHASSAGPVPTVEGSGASGKKPAKLSSDGPSSGASTLATATSPSASPPSTEGGTAAPADGPLPPGFRPQSATFVSSRTGWVLGWAPCSSPPCTSLVRTRDGGRTWHGIPAPLVGLAGRNRDDRVRFADLDDGWVFGGSLVATHDGGARWQRVLLPGLGGPAVVLDLEASDGLAHALAAPVRSDGAVGTAHLYRTDTSRDDWRRVPGVAIPRALSGTLVLHGQAGWLLAAVQGEGSGRYYATLDGRTWVRRPWPCPGGTGGQLAASSVSALFLVCGDGAAAGSQRKLAFVSRDGGRIFHRIHSAPLGGDLIGAAAPAGTPSTAVVSAASGASFIYATFDAGRRWQTASERGDGGLGWYDLGFTTAFQGIAIHGRPVPTPGGRIRSQLFMTRDGGHTWRRVPFRS